MDNCWISCQVMADMKKRSLRWSHNYQPVKVGQIRSHSRKVSLKIWIKCKNRVSLILGLIEELFLESQIFTRKYKMSHFHAFKGSNSNFMLQSLILKKHGFTPKEYNWKFLIMQKFILLKYNFKLTKPPIY